MDGKVSEKCATIAESIKEQPPFAFSKLVGEQYLRNYSRMYGLQIISHRMSGIVGAGQTASINHGWIANLVRCTVNTNEGQISKFTIFGDGNQTRDILHITDYVDLIEDELYDFKKYSDGGFSIYNIGGGPSNELSINQAIDILEKDFSCRMEVKQSTPRIGEPRRYASDIERIKAKGWHANIKDKRKIIEELVDWFKNTTGEFCM